MNTLIPRQLAVENGDGHDHGSIIIARVWTSNQNFTTNVMHNLQSSTCTVGSMILSITKLIHDIQYRQINYEQVVPIESTQPPETFSQVRTQSIPMEE